MFSLSAPDVKQCDCNAAPVMSPLEYLYWDHFKHIIIPVNRKLERTRGFVNVSVIVISFVTAENSMWVQI